MSNIYTKKPLKIGITGGIGSGKTTVCKLFEEYGIPVYYSDERGKYLMEHDPEVIKAIKQLLGRETYPDGDMPDRKLISQKVFADKELLNKLNQIVHPAVRKDAAAWYDAVKNIPYAIQESAIYIESGLYKHFDKVILVTAPEDKRIERTVARDHSTPESVRERIRNQMSDIEKRKFADFEIRNDGTESLTKQVNIIHKYLLAEYFKS